MKGAYLLTRGISKALKLESSHRVGGGGGGRGIMTVGGCGI